MLLFLFDFILLDVSNSRCYLSCANWFYCGELFFIVILVVVDWYFAFIDIHIIFSAHLSIFADFLNSKIII